MRPHTLIGSIWTNPRCASAAATSANGAQRPVARSMKWRASGAAISTAGGLGDGFFLRCRGFLRHGLPGWRNRAWARHAAARSSACSRASASIADQSRISCNERPQPMQISASSRVQWRMHGEACGVTALIAVPLAVARYRGAAVATARAPRGCPAAGRPIKPRPRSGDDIHPERDFHPERCFQRTAGAGR